MNAERIISESHKLMQAIQNETTLQSIQFGCEQIESSVQEAPSTTIKDFLNAPLGSDKDAQLKKIMATAITLAKQNDCLPVPLPSSEPVDIAKFADEALSRVKIGYQAATGILDPVEVADALIDTAAARVVAVIEYAFESGAINKALTQGTVVVLTYFKVPNAQAYAPYISKLINKIEKPIKEKIIQGINIIQNKSKVLIRQVATSIKEYVKNKITVFA